MVSLSVNLLPRRGASEILRQRLFFKLRRSSAFVLVAYVVFLLVVLGVRLFLANQKNSVEASVRQAKVRVDAFATTESQQALLKSKLLAASGVLRRRRDWSGFLSDILAFVPDSKSVTEVALNEAGDLRIRVQTLRLQEMALMLNALVQLGLVHEQVRSVSLSEVRKTTDGAYEFMVVIGTRAKTEPTQPTLGKQ